MEVENVEPSQPDNQMEQEKDSSFSLQAFDDKPVEEKKEKKIRLDEPEEKKEPVEEFTIQHPSNFQWGRDVKYFTDETITASPPAKEITGIDNARTLSQVSNGGFFSLPYIKEHEGVHSTPCPGVPMENELTPSIHSWVLNHLPHTTTSQVDWRKFLPSHLSTASFSEVKAWLDEDPDRKAEIQIMALTEEKKIKKEIQEAIMGAHAEQRTLELKSKRSKEVQKEQKTRSILKEDDIMGDHEVINPFSSHGGGRQTVKQIKHRDYSSRRKSKKRERRPDHEGGGD